MTTERLRRIGTERLAERFPATESLGDRLLVTNKEQFDLLNEPAVLLFYTETETDVIFDPDNDTVLLDMHRDPFAFRSTAENVEAYQALITRAHYECKLHPNQQLVREQVATDLGVPSDDFLIFVYHRDAARNSHVKNRERAPFTNTLNGLRADRSETVQLVLFAKYSHDPFATVSIVWQRAARLNSSFGVVAVRVNELLMNKQI
jgi:hypothetical protein